MCLSLGLDPPSRIGRHTVSDVPLRVAIMGVNYEPEKSGIAPYTTGLATGLARAGHAVRVFTSRPHYPEWRVPHSYIRGHEFEVRDGVSVRRLRHYIPCEPSGVRRACFELAFGSRLASVCWDRPDVVVCVSPALLSSAVVVCRAHLQWRRPAIGLVIQDLYSRGVIETGMATGRLSRAASSMESSVLRACDGVVAIHERFRSQMVTTLGVDPARISVIRNWTHISGVEDFDLGRFRAELGWRPDEIVVVHTGAMGVKQGLENVVRAARLADGLDRRIRFVLIGDGSRRPYLERFASGVTSIQIMDSLDQARFGRALRSADVLLVNERPGVSDMAVPSKLTSYFSAGRPVLAATDPRSTTAEELASSGGGIQVAAGDPEALIDGALRIASQPDAGLAMGQSGQRYSRDLLSEETAIENYDKWVRALSERHARGGSVDPRVRVMSGTE